MNWDKGSVIAVLEAVTRYGEISRAELSQVTGFSRVTVGKAVELLDSIGMVEQYKVERGSVGRKAEICRLDASRGMLLFELAGNSALVRICDAALATVKEYKSDIKELSDVFIGGFGDFYEAFGDGLLGIGCIVPDGKATEYTPLISDALGHEPEVVLESGTAYAIADSRRFEYDGAAFFVRLLARGEISVSIMCRGIPYPGAHGRAGCFGGIAETSDELIQKLAEAAMLIDPALIHIACEEDDIAKELGKKLSDIICSLSGADEPLAEIIAEPLSLCKTPLDGAAMYLRERTVIKKLTNNS